MNIVAAIEQQERYAARGNLQEDRQDALDRYLGREYGDEMEGRSSVVMRDVADTIEWIKPSLMKVFASGDEVVRFDPIGPEDEKQAEQETDYCNHVLMQKNNGFMVLHDWFHDALLQKNGYVMAQHLTEKVPSKQRFQGLTDDEFALLMQGEGIEVLEHTETDGYHDAVIRQVREYGCVKLTNIPPERVRISASWPHVHLDGCPFVRVMDRVTISDLRQMGYDVADDISDTGNSEDWDTEQFRSVANDGDDERDNETDDPSSREVDVRYCWIKYDEDGDGIAELRKVVVVGTTVLENEEDDLIPLASLTPIRQPHEHDGQSVADIVSDLQRIRTVLVRGFLDNMYLANNGRNAIDVNTVNLDDMLVTRPGGVVRVNGPVQHAIAPLIHPQDGGSILQAVEYVDTIRENRTGVTKYNQGLDANSLNKTATGINQIMTASQQRVEMIARVFAETGVKALMLIIHALSLKHSRQQEMIKLRNEWVPVNPSEWNERRDLSVSVGLGTGNKDQMLQHLMMLMQVQEKALMIGVASPQNIYNAAEKLAQNAGFKQADEFFTNPANQPPQPPKPDPEMMKVQMEGQAKQQEMQLKQQQAQSDIQFKAQDAQIELEKARVELQIKMAELEIKKQDLQLRAEGAMFDQQVAQQKTQFEAEDRQTQRAEQRGGGEPDERQQATEQTVQQLVEAVTSLMEEMNAPSQIERDEKGRAIGVRRGDKVRQILRDESGKALGLQ